MIVLTCQSCEQAFETTRRDTKFCSAACRKRAHRSRIKTEPVIKQQRLAGGRGNVVSFAERKRERSGTQLSQKAQAELKEALGDPDGALETAVRAQLDAAEVPEANPDRVLTLQLAKRLDHSAVESGSGIKALTAAFHAASDRAMTAGKKQGDALDAARSKVQQLREQAGA